MADILEAYEQSLSELTFNSRPIIDTLTTIAKENSTIADGIIDLISQRIYKAIPDQKLFALYLLDSICKTIGNPYCMLVGDDIFALYSHVFQLVNEQTRTKLVGLFETWKVSKVRGTTDPLFPRSQIDKIDQFLNKAGYPKSSSGGKKTMSLTNKSLIDDINQLIPLFERKLKSSNDIKVKDKYEALKQLKLLLNSQQMKQVELLAVQSQLNNIKEQELTPTPPPAANAAPLQIQKQQQQVQQQQPRINPAIAIFPQLIQSGLIKKHQEPIPGSKPSYSLVFPKIKYVKPSNELPSNNTLEDILNASSSIQRSEYEKLKFGELLLITKKITNTSLQDFINGNKPTTQTINLLYDAKPSKCSICGKRFSVDDEGSATRKRLHLDWHFRINKKLSASGGGGAGGGSAGSNVQSRGWYLDDYDWVKFKDDALLEYATTGETQREMEAAAAASDVDVYDKNHKVPYVVVASSDTNMNNRCLICREQVKASYNDEIGEWCWFGCMKNPGEGKNSRKIVHVSCFNESNKKRSAEGEVGGINVKRGKY
ncbi:uncharacterized protein J8A68_005625 [[Candida] subhashii]|uniref:CID domain-containing protein n=1 Tax=[Candida] subhashii TaxID=561895 RepID=A0A8J5QDR8_9ASCO|nr:uncharacterized protein J8A68_005625 [[Candida] subhashii]KAG7660808.1 hypothetical protein J8A68_005625 [[Candida] subhashii]